MRARLTRLALHGLHQHGHVTAHAPDGSEHHLEPIEVIEVRTPSGSAVTCRQPVPSMCRDQAEVGRLVDLLVDPDDPTVGMVVWH